MKQVSIFLLFLLIIASSCTIVKKSYNKYYEDLSPYTLHYNSDIKQEEFTSSLPTSEEIKNQEKKDLNIATSLDKKLSEFNKNRLSRKVNGYSIQLYSGKDKTKANEAKSLVYRIFPQERPTFNYIQPNFKVKLTGFTEYMEVQMKYAKIKKVLPNAIIIPEKVNLQ